MKYYIPNLLLGQEYYRYLMNHIDDSIIRLIRNLNYIKNNIYSFSDDTTGPVIHFIFHSSPRVLKKIDFFFFFFYN